MKTFGVNILITKASA